MDNHERHHFYLTPRRNAALRVGVVAEDGRRSGTFGIYSAHARGKERADIYISGRAMGGDMKVSLHASGVRQVGLTEEHIRDNPLPPDRSRHFDRWEHPVRINEEIDLEYVLRFPTRHLREMPDAARPRKVHWIPAAPEDSCLDIGIFVSRPTDQININFNGNYPVAFEKLTDGRFLILAARHVELGRHDNEAAIVADLQKIRATRADLLSACDRLLLGFVVNGLRGWVDYSTEQFLEDAQQRPIK